MDQPLFNEWMDELESGRWEQTHGRLHDDTGHCCLGVLGEICANRQPNLGLEWDHDPVENEYLLKMMHGEALIDSGDCMLPDTLIEAIGFSGEASNVFASWNDDDKFTFDEIADRARRAYGSDGEFHFGWLELDMVEAEIERSAHDASLA